MMNRAQTKDEPSPKTNDNWAHDPTEEEPDDSEVTPPRGAPEETEERIVNVQADLDDRFRAVIEHREQEEAECQAREASEKIEMAARIAALQQELTALRETHLTMQSDTAAKQTEVLAKAIHEKQMAESQIAMLKEDVTAAKHLSNVRIKEVEDRNAILEKQLKDTHIELTNTVEKLMNAQHTLQEITAAANKEGAQQKLQLLDAQHQQDELYRAIHDKELALTEEKEKTQALMEKYNSALQRMGEMIRKIEKTRVRMKEISAEFDVYVNDVDDITTETERIATKAPTTAASSGNKVKPEMAAKPLQDPQIPTPATTEVPGTPRHDSQNISHREQVLPRPNIWRKIASFF